MLGYNQVNLKLSKDNYVVVVVIVRVGSLTSKISKNHSEKPSHLIMRHFVVI